MEILFENKSVSKNTKYYNYTHFILVQKLRTENEIQFWTENTFQTLMSVHLKKMKLKQGGSIQKTYFKKIDLSCEKIHSSFLIFGILFEKRVNLTTPDLFSFSYVDLERNKSFHFENYFFLKIRKNKFVEFFEKDAEIFFRNNFEKFLGDSDLKKGQNPLNFFVRVSFLFFEFHFFFFYLIYWYFFFFYFFVNFLKGSLSNFLFFWGF